MEFGFFYIDFASIADSFALVFGQNPLALFGYFWAGIGWLIFIGPLSRKILSSYIEAKENKYTSDWKPVVLAIDIPALNVQTPKAVEQMFAQLAGAVGSAGFEDKLTEGFVQRNFSLEIVSIEGYIQFVVWTEAAFRDLMEASVYAQYPDAEIVEIEDYTKLVPEKLPSDTHDIWISDFGLAEDSAYPIRSYTEFEHSISKDTVLKDPIGTFLESFSRLGPGEQMWFQVLIEPTDNSWKEAAINKIKEILGIAEVHKAEDHIGDKFVKMLMKGLVTIGDQVFNREPHSEEAAEDDHGDPPKLTPGVHKVIEKMEEKINKIAFKTKMRGAYIARKEVFNPRRGVNLMIGAINQYNIPSSNSIVTISGGEKAPDLLKAYINRSLGTKSPTCIMNIEELATIWHFPMSHVKTPLITKATSKQAEPPVGLPIEFLGGPEAITMLDKPALPTSAVAKKGKQYTTDSGEVIDYDDWYKNL